MLREGVPESLRGHGVNVGGGGVRTLQIRGHEAACHIQEKNKSEGTSIS